MIPIPQRQLIEFLDWLVQFEPSVNIRDANRDMLRELAQEYLRQNRQEKQKGVSILQILQVYPRVYYQGELRSEITHLVGCHTCWEMVANAPVNIAEIKLHPFLSAFNKYLLNKDIPIYIHSANTVAREGTQDFTHNIGEYFKRHGERLVNAFDDFFNATDPNLIKDYLEFHAEQGNKQLSKNETENRENQDLQTSEGRDTMPVRYEGDINSESERIVESVYLLIRGTFYQPPRQLEVINLLARANLISKNYRQALEFLSWLRETYPSLDITANAPTDEIKELAIQFCENFEYPNSASFSKEVVRWVQGKGEPGIIQGLIDIGQWIKGNSARPRKNVSPFERYKTIQFHGLFLFLSAGDFPKFVKTYWEDLNHLTGDYIDIYYSDDDVERKISAYETKNEFRSLRVLPMALPALVIWQDSLKDACVVSLERLSHDDIFDLMKLIVQKIQLGNSLLEIHRESVEFVQRKTLAMQPAFQVYFSGDNIMGDKIDFNNANITNNGGQMFLGKFQDVIANLNASGQQEFGNALTNVKNEIEKSDKLSETEKQEVLEMVQQIGAEAAKSKPNKPMLQALGDGLLKALKAIPDLVKVVGVLIALMPK